MAECKQEHQNGPETVCMDKSAYIPVDSEKVPVVFEIQFQCNYKFLTSYTGLHAARLNMQPKQGTYA